jgi:hypothetical protein
VEVRVPSRFTAATTAAMRSSSASTRRVRLRGCQPRACNTLSSHALQPAACTQQAWSWGDLKASSAPESESEVLEESESPSVCTAESNAFSHHFSAQS